MAFSSPTVTEGRAVMGSVSHVRCGHMVNFDHLAKVNVRDLFRKAKQASAILKTGH